MLKYNFILCIKFGVLSNIGSKYGVKMAKCFIIN